MATVADEIDRLEGLSTFELRTLWRRQWKQPPPMRLSRDMLIRCVAGKLQEIASGGLRKLENRKLAALAKSASEQRPAEGEGSDGSVDPYGLNKKGSVTSPSAVILHEGNRLVREWNGTTHTVLVLAEGYEWQGRQYRSLSQIAEAITGAHWSGPRFFGLTKRKPDPKVAASELSVAREHDRTVGSATGRL